MIWLIALGALLLAGGAYLALERLGQRAWLPAAARAVAWVGIGVLVVNLRCPAAGTEQPPLVLLDGSLSARADTAAWHHLRDSLAAVGEVRAFGDERPATNVALERGRSRLASALAAAGAVGRPVLVVTDGEVEDAGEIPADILRRTTVVVRKRPDSIPVALLRVSGAERLTAGDTLEVEGEVRAFLDVPGDTVRVEVRQDGRRLGARRVSLKRGAQVGFRIPIPTGGLRPGYNILTVTLAGQGGLPTAERWLRVQVVETPGVVMLASPPDWDSRFLYQTLEEVSQLPVRGYTRLIPGQWRALNGLRTVPEAAVRDAVRQADLLVIKGAAAEVTGAARARGIVRWPSGEGGEALIPGDWYVSTPASSPIAGAFVTIPIESLPPAIQVTPVQPGDGDWIGLLGQAGRRGALRPILTGGLDGRRRVVTVSADGLWRWAFAGDAGEQGYRNLVAAMVSWLLAAPDTAAGRAVPVRGVVERARPVLFRWQATGPTEPVAITLQGRDSTARDTLRFDGQGIARLWLPVGAYRYVLPGGGAGVLAVEPYSNEWLPRPVTLRSQIGAAPDGERFRSAREALWLFGLVVAALAVEWFIRRRMGLR